MTDPELLAFYTDRYDENVRLSRSAHGQLEYLRTVELIDRHLPKRPGLAILDVGGGTGAHARWLGSAGHAVHLIDPVPGHVAAAADLAGVSAELGDARQLPGPSAQYDVVLLLGPLYHLRSAAERASALAEAVRVVKPGGVVLAAAISRYAPLIEFGSAGQLEEADLPELHSLLADGANFGDPNGFPAGHFHHVAELRQELTVAGLLNVSVFGVEGPTSAALDASPPERWPQLLPSAVLCARFVEQDPALIAASAHLLAIGSRAEADPQ